AQCDAGSLDCSESCFARSEHLRMDEHKGFGGCLYCAFRRVSTPYVLVLQHDRPAIRSFDAASVLAAMEASPEQVKYVGLPTKSSLARTGDSHLASCWHIQTEVVKVAADSDATLRPLLF
ncbi:unnamed protein product, partial [Polarella glacialis]